MSRLNLRRKPRISYYEPEEPNLDEYLFCSECADYVFEYCAIHGPLLVIPDNKVLDAPNYPSYIPRSALTIPDVFLHLAPSTIPGAGIGVFSTLTLPKGVRFGPYTGEATSEVNSMYCWQLYGRDNKPSHVVDASDANKSNWMRYVNCSRRWQEQNLLAYQYQGQLYYRTVKIIPKFTELMVFYGSKFARLLNINLRYYNSPKSFAVKFGAQPPKKQNKKATDKENDKKSANSPDNNNRVQQDKIPFGGGKQVQPLKSVKFKGKNTVKSNKNEVNQKDSKQTKCFTDDGKIKPSVKITDDVSSDNTHNNLTKQSYCNSDGPIDAIRRLADNNEANSLKHINSFYFTCTECNYRSSTRETLSRHMNFHDLNRKFKCKDCGLRYKSLKKHYCKFNISYKQYTCSYCDRKFTQNQDLTKHLRTHTGEKPYTCSYCDRKFSDQSSFTKHLRTHTGEKPFTCSYCDRKFTQHNNLTRHLITHTGEKPFTCSHCDREFTRKDSLTTHLRTHTGEKPFTCSYCDRKFNQYNNLTRHLRTHTGEKPFTCSYCDLKFSDYSNLSQHLRTHTGEKPFTCSYCDRKFTRKIYLTTHLRTHTGEKP